jgi:hypothetical protein
MPKDLSREDVAIGDIVYHWTVKEYEKYPRGRSWYIGAGIIAVALLAYALFTGNNIFALIIILFTIVLYLQEMHDPLDIDFAITQTGIVLGIKYYRFSELENFWIIYAPDQGVKNLYFSPTGYIKHRLQIPLLDYDPRPIRDYLNQFLIENLEEEEEPWSEKMARLLKIH